MMEKVVMLLIENTAIFAVLLAAVWLMKTAFKKQLTAQLQYLIWGVVVLKLLIPFSMTTQWSPYVLIESASQKYLAVVEQVNSLDENTVGQQPQYTFDQAEPIRQTGSTVQAVDNTQPKKAVLPNQTPQVLKPLEIEWMVLTVSVWLAGIVVCGVWFIRKAHQLRKKVYRCRTGDAPEWMRAVLEQCKAELGISRDIRIVVQGALPVPAIMGVFRPILMVPESLAIEKNMQKTYHVFTHELMHGKRHDILAIWLLNALCAVYWFNPLIWLSCRLIHRDMEAACDSMVVEKLGTAHRQCYIETILQFSGRNEFAHVKAAMSLNDGCMKLQQRIRSMYMKKTSRRVKVTVLSLALAMLFAAFTSGCQPTPEKPIVQNKNNDSVAQAIAQSSKEVTEVHTYSAPETWQDEARDEAKNIDITIDANVVVPVDAWGLYELVPISANKEDTQKMLKAIVGDTPIYGEETLQSKDQLIEQIANYKEQKASFEELYANGGLSEDEKLAKQVAGGIAPTPHPDGQSVSSLSKEDVKQNIEIFTQMIAELEEKLRTAPDEDTVVNNEFNLDVMFDENATSEQASDNGMILSKQGDYRDAYVNGKADLGRETHADISIEYGSSSYGESFSLNFTDYDDYEQGFFEGKDYTGQELFKCDIDVNDAADMAREKVSEMGFDYLNIAKTQVCAMLDRKRKEGDDKFPECFEFIFTHELDGAVATYAYGSGSRIVTEEEDMENAEYAPRWTNNEVTVYVDDSGIIGIKIRATKSKVNRQAYGIELKDFSHVMDIFKKQVFIKNAYSGPGDMNKVIKRDIHINEIRLGYMPTPWKDHAGKIIFTPVWDFFGNEVTTFEDGIGGDLGEFLNENNALALDLDNQSLLTINALDGTIIDRDG